VEKHRESATGPPKIGRLKRKEEKINDKTLEKTMVGLSHLISPRPKEWAIESIKRREGI